ncbi:MAG: AMP-binding protein [Myxococcales bacterium]|jgi:long-chain acyl-CoA synthetase
MGVSIGQVLRQSALSRPGGVAVTDLGGGRRRDRTFAELDSRARAVARHLHAVGAEAGDAVALMASNSEEFVAAWFGIVYAGCAVVPIPILSAPPEVRYRVEHSSCRALVHDAEREAVASEATRDSGPVARLPVESLGEGHAPLPYPVDTAPGDDAMVLYTSGTTGKAKGAAISHASLMTHTAVLVHHHLGLTEDDCVMGVLPLTHSYGCRMAMLVTFFAGARSVLVPRFDAAGTLDIMCEQQVSWLPAVPTMYAAWGAEPQGPAPQRLRWCLSAGAPLADSVALRAEARLGAEVRQGFGMTEATFSTLNAPPDARVLGSVGRPVWGIEVRIVGEAHNDLPAGQDGELLVRGHNVMTRYLHDPEATAEARSDGWMRSGDVGRLDAEGRLTIVDRIKDLIIRGGNNVYPSEVEDALAHHPAVREVAVVGRPDEYYGEEVVAVVVPRDGHTLTAAELIEFARTQVARTKVPREVAIVERFPLGPSGKVLKRELRAMIERGDLKPERPGGG